MSRTAERAAGFSGLPEIHDREFDAVRDYLYRETGISLGVMKKALVVSRLASRMRALAIRSFAEYTELAARDPSERQRMIDALATNETQFFREPAHWDLVRRVIVPSWREEAGRGERAKQLRIWSAGCSTGEEPFSIAMLLLNDLPPDDGWKHEVLATDISHRALERAMAATWSEQRQGDIPRPLLERFMLRGTGSRQGLIRAAPEVREIVSFTPFNLNDPRSWPRGHVDIIFCRNVLIYFDADSRRRAVDQLLMRLTSGGYFFLGHAESLAASAKVRSIAPNVYVRR